MFVTMTPVTINSLFREPIEPLKFFGDSSAKYNGNIPEKSPIYNPKKFCLLNIKNLLLFRLKIYKNR